MKKIFLLLLMITASQRLFASGIIEGDLSGFDPDEMYFNVAAYNGNNVLTIGQKDKGFCMLVDAAAFAGNINTLKQSQGSDQVTRTEYLNQYGSDLVSFPAGTCWPDDSLPPPPPPPPAGNALADLVATMNVGDTVELPTNGLNRDLLWYDSATQPMLAYSSIMPYDSIHSRIYFMGEPHNQKTRMIMYDVSTNTWSKVGQNDPQPFLGPLSGGTGGGGHGYYHQTVSVNGDFYWREFGRSGNAQGLERYDTTLQEWDSTFYGGVNFYKDVNAIADWPNAFGQGMEGIVDIDRSLGVSALNLSTNTWQKIATSYGATGLHMFAIYIPVDDAVMFGGGDGVDAFYKLENAGTGWSVTLMPVPLPTAVSAANGAVAVASPAGDALWLVERAEDGYKGRIWAFNNTTSTWSLLPFSHNFYNAADPSRQFVVSVLPEYGALVAIVDDGYGGSPTMKVLKVQ